MKNIILPICLSPLALFGSIETFEFFQNCTVQKGKIKNTIQVDGIRFFDLTNMRTLYVDASVEGVYGNNFSTSCGVGIRQYFDGFGIGVNSYWDYTNESKFSINQVGIGVEFLMDEFCLFYNRNTPLSKDRASFLYEVTFATSSQLGIKHQLTEDFFYALSANICCFNNKIGFKAECQKRFENGLSLGTSVMYNGDKSPAISFSVGYHFGDMKEQKYHKPIRDRRVCYNLIHAGIKEELDKFVIVPPQQDNKVPDDKGFFSFLDWNNSIFQGWKSQAIKVR